MTIRPATLDDLPSLIWNQNLAEFQEVFQDQIKESIEAMRIYLVAELDGEIVGQIEGTFEKRTAYISALRVKEKFQNQGIGTLLIQAMEQKLLQQGVTFIRISVGLDNINARILYEKLGYKINGQRKDRWHYAENGVTKTFEEEVWDLGKNLDSDGLA